MGTIIGPRRKLAQVRYIQMPFINLSMFRPKRYGVLCFKPSPLLLQQMYSSINSKYTLQIIYLELAKKIFQFILIRLYFYKTYQVGRLGWNCSCKENEMFRPQMHVSFPHAIKLIRSEDILIRHDMNSDLGHLSFMLSVIFSRCLQILFAFTLLIHSKICIL